MPAHTADPKSVLLRVNGANVRLTSAQVSALRFFGVDGVLRDLDPDVQAVRALARHGWVLRTRGRFVLTPRGRDARAALDAYLARKAEALQSRGPS